MAGAAVGKRKPLVLSEAKWLGFDLDHTLIRYNNDELFPMVARCILNYLVEVAGYPASLREAKLDWDICRKGLVLDRLRGNFLKLDGTGAIVAASHGSVHMSRAEIDAVYPPGPLAGFDGHFTAEFWPMYTFFDSPTLPVLAILIDEETKGKGKYSEKIQHVLDSLNYNFNTFAGRGWFFTEMIARTRTYIIERPNVRRWLENLKASGHKLFLLTNSMVEYTELLMACAFGADWRDLFEFLVFKARKPVFFTETEPFFTVTWTPPTAPELVEVAATESLKPHRLYQGGNSLDLFSAMIDENRRAQRGAPEGTYQQLRSTDVVYFGDHLMSDCFTCTGMTTWKVMGIIEEMESGLEKPSAHWGTFFEGRAGTGAGAADEPAAHSYWHARTLNECDACVPDLEVLTNVPFTASIGVNGVIRGAQDA